MSRFSHYGSGQRLAFAMMLVGFGLCMLGAVVPYWMKSEVKLSDVSLGIEKEVPLVGDLLNNIMSKYNLVKMNLGVWVLCLEFVGSETKCYNMYSSDEDTPLSHHDYNDRENSWIEVVRVAIAINIKLSLICGLVACCRCMCCSGGRTICHGVFALLAGGFGVFASAIMAAHKDDLVPGIPIFEVEYDWAFFMYAGGSGLMILASLFLCFSVPRETPGAVVMMPGAMPGAAPYISVNTTNTNQNVMNAPVTQYELNGQIRSFEPLPEQPVFQNPPPPAY